MPAAPRLHRWYRQSLHHGYDRAVLYGRAPERAAIDAVLHDARGSRSGCLMSRGEPGLGKTALLSYAVEHGLELSPARPQPAEDAADPVGRGTSSSATIRSANRLGSGKLGTSAATACRNSSVRVRWTALECVNRPIKRRHPALPAHHPLHPARPPPLSTPTTNHPVGGRHHPLGVVQEGPIARPQEVCRGARPDRGRKREDRRCDRFKRSEPGVASLGSGRLYGRQGRLRRATPSCCRGNISD